MVRGRKSFGLWRVIFVPYSFDSRERKKPSVQPRPVSRIQGLISTVST